MGRAAVGANARPGILAIGMTTGLLSDLRGAPLFSSLTDEQLARVAAVVRTVELPAGATVFLQGDPADAFYILASGAVKITKTFRDGRTATIRHVSPGETFAESVLYVETYPSTTETMAPSRLYRFGTSEFRALMIAEPELAVRIIAAMAQLLVMLNQRVEDLLLPVPARLARYLLELCDQQGTAESCKLQFSKQELAARLGTVPETLSRTLSRFVRSGLVTVSGPDFRIRDRAGLERVAQRLAAG